MSTETLGSQKPDATTKPGRPKSILNVVPWAQLLMTLAGSCGAWFWAFDLCAHFRWYYFVISLTWAIAIWKQARSFTMAGLCVSILWNGGLLLPYYVPARQLAVPADATSISLISLNVYTANPDKAAVLAYLRNRQPDLIVVMEVDQRWEQALDELKDVYPHRLIQSRTDNFGIGLLSKWPLQNERLVKLADTDLPNVVATIEREGRSFFLVATHPLPPLGAGYTRKRDAQLREVAKLASESSVPCVVAGDFNATPWSSAFRDFAKLSGLRDSALGRGIQGSWNAKSRLIRIPIDQVFTSKEVIVTRRVLGPSVGSDHFPVEVTFTLP
jgi:endonuclease/exonuclease/phosphatase (EEP) superfamily protein YafD